MKSSFLLGLVAAAAASAAPSVLEQGLQQRQSNWTVGQQVNTTSGPVDGHPAKSASDVSEYLGIPYAKAPIGDLRFAAPVKYDGTSSHNGSSFGASCPVQSSSSAIPNAAALQAANITAAGFTVLTLLSNTGAKYSEDCLYANVWTKPQTGESKKAVLVWIYGGGFQSGSSSIPGYNGASLAAQEDVVLVSFNYRLNVLGFPGNPDATNNLGLLDQRLAVEWVRDNIAKFGGDPSRITLFGQSAGGASVDFYSYAWNNDPIAAGLIPESGTVFSWGLPSPKSRSAGAWFNVTATLGCGDATSDSAAILSCMRKQDYTSILKAIPTLSGAAGILGSFGPTADEKVVFSNYSQRTPAAVPMLIGNNNYEGGLFRTEFALQGIFSSDSYWDDFNLQEFTCPAGVRANSSVAAKNPTWRYRHMGVFPNLAVSSEAGTWHGAEIPLIFNTVPTPPPSTDAEISIGNYMRGAWTAFAKDPVKGLETYGWPRYDVTKDTLVRLGYNNITGPNLINPYKYDADCIFVNVSSTDSSAGSYPSLVDLGANVTPTGTASGAPSSTGGSASGSTTGSAGASPTPAVTNTGGRLEVSVWVGLGAALVAWIL